MSEIRVHIAHDNPLQRDTLAYALAAQPDIKVVEMSPEGEAGLEKVDDRRADVLLLAIPNWEEVFEEVCRYRRLTPTTKIVGLYRTGQGKNGMIAAGADAVVDEYAGLAELIKAIRRVAPR